MPDTGAPWNIPYVEAADLVSDWPADSLALANAIDAGLDAAQAPGIGSNVIQTQRTSVFSTTSSTPQVFLTTTITPTSATSKVLLLAHFVAVDQFGNRGAFVTLHRAGTSIWQGDAGGSNVQATSGTYGPGGPGIVYVDSPATTSAVDYTLRLRRGSTGTAYVGQTILGTTAGDNGRFPSSLIAIEVAA